MNNEIIYTADDEYPDCGRCDHICDRYDLCCDKCGEEYWWQYYKRTEYIKDEKEKNNGI